MKVSTRTSRALIGAALTALAVLGGTGSTSAVSAPGDGTHATRTTPQASPYAQLDGQWGDDDTREDEHASDDGKKDKNNDENENDDDDGNWRAERDQGSLNWINKMYGARQAWGRPTRTGAR